MTKNETSLRNPAPNGLNVVRTMTDRVINRTTPEKTGAPNPLLAERLRAWEHTASAYRPKGSKLIAAIPADNGLELTDVADRIDQLMDLCEREATDSVEVDDLLAALRTLRQVRSRLLQAETLFIRAARHQKVTWAQLAESLEVGSRQAAERRYLQVARAQQTLALPQSVSVEQERDRRAGVRAVKAWTAANSSRIYTVARQVSGHEPLRQLLENILGTEDQQSEQAPQDKAQLHLSAWLLRLTRAVNTDDIHKTLELFHEALASTEFDLSGHIALNLAMQQLCEEAIQVHDDCVCGRREHRAASET